MIRTTGTGPALVRAPLIRTAFALSTIGLSKTGLAAASVRWTGRGTATLAIAIPIGTGAVAGAGRAFGTTGAGPARRP